MGMKLTDKDELNLKSLVSEMIGYQLKINDQS